MTESSGGRPTGRSCPRFIPAAGRSRAALLATVAAAACLVAGGCGSSGLAGVHGQVTLAGAPLPDVVVVFWPEAGGRGSVARTDAQGRYVLRQTAAAKGVPPGRHRVTIEFDDPVTGDEGQSPAASRPALPPPLAKPETTPLRFEVRPGRQQIDIAVPAG